MTPLDELDPEEHFVVDGDGSFVDDDGSFVGDEKDGSSERDQGDTRLSAWRRQPRRKQRLASH